MVQSLRLIAAPPDESVRPLSGPPMEPRYLAAIVIIGLMLLIIAGLVFAHRRKKARNRGGGRR